MLRRLFLLSLLLMAAGCASAEVAPENRTRTLADRLTHEEIVGTGLANMFDVIQRLQPGWLRTPYDTGHQASIGVFLDGLFVGHADFLRQMPPSQIGEAWYLSQRDIAAELTRSQQMGIGSAIMLRTVRR